jgi:hypothetical protein
MIRKRLFPWWSDPHFRGAFFRPLNRGSSIPLYELPIQIPATKTSTPPTTT